MTLQEVREQWTLEDLLDAHIVLDLLEEAHAKAAPKPPKAPTRKPR